MKSMLVIRWIMVALTALLAVLLIARGNVVIGVVLAALAVMRVMLLVRMNQRREKFRQRMQERSGRRF
jgi:membrane protein implicated in regulation of membrane protease activity